MGKMLKIFGHILKYVTLSLSEIIRKVQMEYLLSADLAYTVSKIVSKSSKNNVDIDFNKNAWIQWRKRYDLKKRGITLCLPNAYGRRVY